jgi:predicted ATP-grasp superfamily ATP-dependent carboligase
VDRDKAPDCSKRARVLVTDADTPKALAIVRAIGREHDVWTAAESRVALAGWSRYAGRHIRYSFESAAGFTPWALAVCKENGIDILITPEEASSLLAARAESQFNKVGTRITTLPLDALEIAMDKARTMQAAMETGIRVPPTRILERPEDALAAARDLGYPVVVKPRYSRYWIGDRFISSDGVGYANSDSQLRHLMKSLDPRLPPPLLQGFIQGFGCGICVLLTKNGTATAEFAHRRLRDYRPTGSGSVLRKSVAVDPRLREISATLLRYIGARGIAMVEFRIDDSGEPYVMEINGRFWGSLQLAVDAGVNFPLLLVNDTLGKPVEQPRYREGVILRWWLGDLIRTLRVLKGKPPGYIGAFPSRASALREFLGPQPKGTRYEILRWADCWPGLVEPLSLLRRVLQ